jgi:hypothetical protein
MSHHYQPKMKRKKRMLETHRHSTVDNAHYQKIFAGTIQTSLQKSAWQH